MTPDTVMSLARESALLILILAGPILGAGLVVGLAVSIFQAVTQIQEMTLSFIPKLVVILAVLGLLGHWMLGRLVGFTVSLLGNLDAYAR
ncbi:MAG TPA: flagellar biosynthesis protein FliQ [Candidatus Bathyarchaeia archaeon]|nr:flagellar biosynthesis protein FliQ [Candidatus Bathyarchaeia archaeon]